MSIIVVEPAIASVSQTVLENGLTVIHQQTCTTDVASVDVWVKAGAIQETDEWLGIAHFLEHMIFKGSDRVPPSMFDREVEYRGGVTNAATSYDYAHYFITTAVQYLDETLPYLAEILLNAAIPDDEFERERDVVLEEIRQSYDNPDCVAFQVLSETVYQRHPYGRPILGTEESLLQLTPEMMRAFHRTYYQPQNMTVVVVGNLSRQAALQLVEQNFSTFPPAGVCPCAGLEAEPPITQIRRQALEMPRLEQARLMMAWLGPGLDSPLQSLNEQLHNAYGLDILSVLLAEGRTSRLVWELREERNFVQAVGSGFSLQRDSGLFTISAWLDSENLERVEAIICDRLSELAATPISIAELERCKRLLCNDYAFSTETPGQLAGLYGYYSLFTHPETVITYPERVRAIQPSDIQRLAAQYLSPYHYAATTMRPLE